MNQHPFHIFECLRALNSIVFSPQRDFSVYDNLVYFHEISLNQYVRFFNETDWPYWFELKRPDFDSFPVMPPALAEWIGDWGGQVPEQPPRVRKYYRNSAELWQPGQVDLSVPNQSGLLGERFDEQQERVIAWHNWLKEEWLPWAQANLERFHAIENYEKFCAVFNQLERGADQFELIVANAVLYWRFDSMEIRHPLITQRMELEYDPEQGSFALVTKSVSPKLEYEMLLDLTGVDFEKLFSLEQKLFEQPIDLCDLGYLEKFCAELAEVIGYDCLISEKSATKNTPVAGQPCIYYGKPIMFLRRRDGRKWRGELEGIVEAINTGAILPEVFNNYYKSIPSGDEFFGRNWKDNLATPFFPWEGEPAHKEILRSLANKSLTVVQAPPKSSKDKLIANLVVHLLAHGKKVLVTGSSSKALQEVSNLLYKEVPDISSLCVSATGTDRENNRELLSALRAHSQKLNYHNKDEVARELADFQKKFGDFQQELSEDRIQLSAAREFEFSRRFNIEGKDLPAWQIAKWIADNREQLDYIPDCLGYDQSCPLHKSEMDRFFELMSRIAYSEGMQLLLELPNEDDLLDAKKLADLFAALEELEEHGEERQELLADCMILNEMDAPAIKEIMLDYQQALANLPGIEGDWLESVLKEIVYTPSKLRLWQDMHQSVLTSLQKIQNFAFAIGEHVVDLPEQLSYRQLRDILYKLRMEFYKNNTLSIIFKLSAGKKVLQAYNLCLIDGLPAQSVKDIDIILAKVDYLNEQRRIVSKWNAAVTDVQGPRIETFEPGFSETFERYALKLKRALDWRRKYLELLEASWSNFARRQPPEWTDRNWLVGMLPRLQAWIGEKKKDELTSRLIRQYTAVSQNSYEAELNPICQKMRDALDKKDVELWQDCQKKILAIKEKRKLWQELDSLYQKLSEVAPLWARSLAEERAEKFVAPPENWFLAWRFKQAEAWLKRHSEGNRLEAITSDFYAKQAQEKALINDIACKSAWYWQLKRVTAEEKRALDFLLTKDDLQYTDNFRSENAYEFLREADFWRLSLPAWIMPVDILLETAGSFDRLFDVVIIADSEKCDVFSTCLMLRGKKTLVIGDSMLVGFMQPVQGRAAAGLLLEKSLMGLPGEMKFDLNDSLYNFALRLAGGQSCFLNERSQQPMALNDFINEHFYNDKLVLVPKPVESSKGFDFVELEEKKLSGLNNREEAVAIVKQLQHLLDLPEYNEKSFAIITLGGLEQQEFLETELWKRLGEDTILKHRLICASIEGYMGGMRDIVLLSLVSAKTAQLADLKKFNNALNLAQEQAIVFVSFTSEDLAPYCVARKLLEEKSKDWHTDEAANSDIEIVADICERLIDKGYMTRTNCHMGNLSLPVDLVVHDGYKKVALMLDGLHNKKEIDILASEEAALARKGWPVSHIRACSFYMNKDDTLSKLLKWLNKSNSGI